MVLKVYLKSVELKTASKYYDNPELFKERLEKRKCL